MLTAARRIRFTVINPKILHKKNQIKNDTRLSFYPVVGFKQTKTGAMTLNKPDNNNNVTQQCADQLFRFLTSYQHDHTVENVWIQNRGPAFSGGADYEELRNNSHYLDKLMRLSVMIGQFNKPIFAKVHGSVRGISAYLLTMFSTPLGTEKSSLRLDETSRGFIPIFGGSYRLSRLPCNIGIYLALTGDKLNAEEMTKLGFLKGTVDDQQCTNKTIRKHISDANLFHRFPYGPSSHGNSQIKRQNFILYKMNYFYDFISETQKELFKTQGNIYSKLALNQYRIAQTQYYNTLNPYNSFTPTDLFVNNHFARKHDVAFNYLKGKQVFEQARTDYHNLARLPVHKLVKVFTHDTLQEVLEELAKDKSDWARRTEEMIRQKDPLAVQLTFNLIKNAKDLTFIEALQHEYKVARRLLDISQIETREISNNRSIQVLTSRYSSKKIEQISKQTVQQFFRPYQTESQIFDHDAPKHSILPTADYWRTVPDAGRNYLNGTFFQDIHSKFGEYEVRRFLHGMKINYKDRSFNLPTLRQYINKKFHYEKLIDLEKQRLKGILQSEIQYKHLKQQRIKYVQQKTKDPQFSKLIAEQIRNYFDSKFKTRFNDLEKTAKIAGKEQRMSTIRKYVNTLIQNIVYNGRYIEDVIKNSNVSHQGIVRFDDKGSDVFHAETAHEKNVAQFNVLKQAYKDNRNIQTLSKMDPNKPKTQNQFFKAPLCKQEHEIIKKDAALRLNYHKTIMPQQIALKYKQLINRASKTSEEISDLMGWQINDIETMLFNAPAHAKTFRQFSEEVMQRSPKIQQRIEELNKLYADVQRQKKQSLPDFLKGEENPSHQNIFFNTKIIPRIFRDAHLPILDQTIKFFSSKYQINGQMYPAYEQKDKNILNQWVSQGLKSNYSKLMKSDVEYVFSYLVIIHLKQILEEVQRAEIYKIQKIIPFLKQKFGLNFEGLNKNQFNSTFMNYLYSVLDMHQQSKHRIIFPQTKMIQFIKRLKIGKQIQNPYNVYSFESLMQLIAKDRKRIRDNANDIVPLLGYDPQITLNTLTTQQKQNNTALPQYRQYLGMDDDEIQDYPGLLPIETMQALTNNSQTHLIGNKNLVVGFVYYLRRFQAMMHKVAGRTMFLPKELYECQQKQTYENLKQLLRIQLNNEEWFKLKLKSAIAHVFDFRYEQEKSMSEGELQLFDQQFSQLFTPEMVTLLMMYQTHTEQSIAKIVLNSDKDPLQTNQNIKSNYLDFKNQIKNPKALKTLNNLIMTQNIINDRIDELQMMTGRRDKSLEATAQERKELDYQRTRWVNRRTYERLAGEVVRFADEDPHFVQKPQFYQKNVLRFVNNQDRKPSRFLEELKEIKNIIESKDLKSQLDNRISRIQALNE